MCTHCLLSVGCYGGIIRTRTDLLENALRKYIVRETGIDVIRVGEIEVGGSASLSVRLFRAAV